MRSLGKAADELFSESRTFPIADRPQLIADCAVRLDLTTGNEGSDQGSSGMCLLTAYIVALWTQRREMKRCKHGANRAHCGQLNEASTC